jgi:toxin ParE1/3/4
MRVRYTPRAFSDLDDIRNYINRHNPDAARRVVAIIETITSRLGNFPESGQQTDEGTARVIYALRYPYRIYYRIESDEISVLHIRHTSRRPVESDTL